MYGEDLSSYDFGLKPADMRVVAYPSNNDRDEKGKDYILLCGLQKKRIEEIPPELCDSRNVEEDWIDSTAIVSKEKIIEVLSLLYGTNQIENKAIEWLKTCDSKQFMLEIPLCL